MWIFCEGLDRTGKSSLAHNLSTRHGFKTMHFGRPEGDTVRDKAMFQRGAFSQLFKAVRFLGEYDVVCDRSHLGELVYGPIYRGDSGVDLSYVHELEAGLACQKDVFLVLLVHQNLDVLRQRDDGLGFDISKLSDEADAFARAFEASMLTNKIMVDVTSKTIEQVYETVRDAVNL